MAPKRESRLVSKLLQVLRAAGWWAVKIHGGPFQRAGLPDILAFKPGHAPLWIEAKVGANEPTLVQRVTMTQLQQAGCRVLIVREGDDFEEIIRAGRAANSSGPVGD